MTERPASASAGLRRAVLAWLLLGSGIGVAVTLVELAHRAWAWSTVQRQLGQATLSCSLVLAGVVLLRCRRDRRGMAGLGWEPRHLAGPLATGVALGAVSGLLVWVPALALGWIGVDAVTWPVFLRFLLLNGLVLALFEAVPEELALRGYAWTSLRESALRRWATPVVMLLFCLTAALGSTVHWLLLRLAGSAPAGPSLFPGEPVSYVVQLTWFHLALVQARRLPLRGALFAAIGFHWTHLTITRVLLGGLGWLESGWRVTWHQPWAVVLVVVHLLVAERLFAVVRRRLEPAAAPSAADEGRLTGRGDAPAGTPHAGAPR